MTTVVDPTTYDYSHPTRSADIVMKGGITSGVVYPFAICELAQVYRLTGIGGTSVGAVAAAGGAAAEYGRETGGFEKLAALPAWLGTGSNLSGLFQPQTATGPVFRIFLAALGIKGLRLVVRVGIAALGNFPIAPLLGTLPGVAIIVIASLAPGSGWLRIAALAAGIVLALVGSAIALVVRIAGEAPKGITANGFGLCSGMSAGPGDPPAITPWLTDLIDDLAGRSGDAPLTFGDLQARGIELTMMTTNLTHRRAQRLPLSERIFFFDPDEWRALFPERVVRWMIDHPSALNADDSDDSARIRQAMLPRLPLPAAADLPVVVGARMSLSFPLLVSAVPLWAFDRTLKANNAALDAKAPPGARATPERCWFSDGGISSNFPVHFFDSALPTRPTFAIDLDGFHPDHPKSTDETANVYLPDTNFSTLLGAWYRFPQRPGLGQLVSFLDGMLRTMQNRVDSTLARQPGYRDRIVHVHTDHTEGGLNLTMPPPVITALTLRGQEAARQLVERFAETPGTSGGMSWDNHRWVRYRTAMAAVGDLLEEFAAAWAESLPAGERTYEELVARGRHVGPNAYRFERPAQRDLAVDLQGRLVAAGVALKASAESLEEGAPRPPARIRVAPRE